MKIFWKIVQWLVLAGFVAVVVFIMNSYRYLIYAFIITSLFYFLLKDVIARKLSNSNINRKVRYEINGKPVSMSMSKLSAFVTLLFIIYALIVAVFAVSPYLDRKEFKLTHPSWTAVTPVIRDLTSNIQRGRTKCVYIDLEYQFTANGSSYEQKVRKAEKRFSYFPIWGDRSFENMRVELLNRANKKDKTKETLLFYDPHNPNLQRFFLANDAFYPQGAWLYDLLFVFSIILLIIICISMVFSLKK